MPRSLGTYDRVMSGIGIIVLTVIIAVLTAIITLVWWKVGDQWADEEYKKFGHGGGAPKGPPPQVVDDFNALTGTQRSNPEQELGKPMDPARVSPEHDDAKKDG